MTVNVNRLPPRYEETFSSSNRLTRSQSFDGLIQQRASTATLNDKQTSNRYTYVDTAHLNTPSTRQVEILLRKFKDFWNEIVSFLQRNLIHAWGVLHTFKISKLGGFSWNIVKIKSIFSFTWQQPLPSNTERLPPHLHVQGAYIEHQTIVINVLPHQLLSSRESGLLHLSFVSALDDPIAVH